jgi:uncharacterized protein YggT (Ycf19 family)
MQPAPDQQPPIDFSGEPTIPLIPQEQGIAGGKGLLPIQPTIPIEPPSLPLPPAQPRQIIQGTGPQRVIEGQESTEIEAIYVSETVAPETPIQRSRRTRKTIRFVFSVIEVLLVLRFFLKVVGANPASPFGLFLFGLTDLLMAPFTSLLPTPAMGNSDLEFTTLLVLAVYPVFGWIISRAIQLLHYKEQCGQEIIHQKRHYDREGR